MPLLVLPKDHPGSKRISYVVSVGPGDPDELLDHAGNSPGTAPDLFSHDELAGITFTGTAMVLRFSALPEGISVQRADYEFMKIAIFSENSSVSV